MVLFWVMARSGALLGKSMSKVAWRISLEKQSRTKRHKWVMKSPRLMEGVGMGRKAETVSS